MYFFLPPLRAILRIKCWRHCPHGCTVYNYVKIFSLGRWWMKVCSVHKPHLFRNNTAQALLRKKIIDSNSINDDLSFLFFPAQTPEAFLPTKNFIKHQDPKDQDVKVRIILMWTSLPLYKVIKRKWHNFCYYAWEELEQKTSTIPSFWTSSKDRKKHYPYFIGRRLRDNKTRRTHKKFIARKRSW